MKNTLIFLLLPVVALTTAPLVQADDWPQWRGPARTGVSTETGLLKYWPEGGPKLVWHAKEIGSGYSTPAIVGDSVYVISNEGLDNEFVQALSAVDGSPLWSTRLGKVGKPDQRPNYPASRSTPTVDGDLLYALGSGGDLAALQTSDGKLVWSKNLLTDFGGESGVWAYSESPLVHGDLLICTPGGATATLLALNKTSGEVVWRCATPEGDAAGYSSAVAAEIHGVQQIVQFLAKGVVGVDAKTGKLLWRSTKTADGSPANIPTPIVHGDLVYTGGGRTGGGLAQIQLTASGFETEEVYFSKKLPTAIGGAVLVGDYLYGAASQALLCVEFATGKIRWEERSVAPGAPIFVDGRLVLHGESGEVALLEATPEAYREHGRFTPPDQPDRGRSKAWAYPAVAQGRLYLRDMTSLWCFDINER